MKIVEEVRAYRKNSKYASIAAPTNSDDKNNYFDTSLV